MSERIIDLSPLKLDNRGRVMWKECIGMKLNFKYDGIESYLIVDEVVSSYKIKISGEHNANYEIKKDDVKGCNLARFLKINTKDYLYNVGDIVNDLEILERTRIDKTKYSDKGYVVRCIKDGYTYNAYEHTLKRGVGCGVCSSNVVVSGINDIATTHPHLVEYFCNKDDAYTNTAHAHKTVSFACKDCGRIKKIRISTLTNYGLGCACGDGQSYPNKFMFNMLTQLGIEFETEYSPKWANIEFREKPRKCRYDFYIPSKKLIIEMDGGLGHGNKTHGNSDMTAEESQYIDDEKDISAINNGMDIVRVDCGESDMGYIKTSILNSKIGSLFELKDVEWSSCDTFALSNLVKMACELWMTRKFKTTLELCNHMGVGHTTVLRYLNSGAKNKWCDYSGSDYYQRYRAKYVKDIEVIKEGVVLDIFRFPIDISKISLEKYGVFLNASKISEVLKGTRKSHKGFTFRYVD